MGREEDGSFAHKEMKLIPRWLASPGRVIAGQFARCPGARVSRPQRTGLLDVRANFTEFRVVERAAAETAACGPCGFSINRDKLPPLAVCNVCVAKPAGFNCKFFHLDFKVARLET